MKEEHISDALNMLNDDIIEETNNVRANAKPKRKWGSHGSTGCPLPFWGTAKGLRWKKTCAATLVCRDRRATARPCA